MHIPIEASGNTSGGDVSGEQVLSLVNRAPQEVSSATRTILDIEAPNFLESKRIVVQFIIDSLAQIDTPSLLSNSMNVRGHHVYSRHHLLESAMQAGILVESQFETFCQNGLPQSSNTVANYVLHSFLAENQLTYFEIVLADKKNPEPTYDYHTPDGQIISYAYEQFGFNFESTEVTDVLSWMLKNARTNLRWFRLHGENSLYYGAQLDEICNNCKGHSHCGLNPQKSSGIVSYDPNEVRFLNWYLEEAQLLPDALGKTIPPRRYLTVKKPVGTENGIELRDEPIVVQTTMRDLRNTIWTKLNSYTPSA